MELVSRSRCSRRTQSRGLLGLAAAALCAVLLLAGSHARAQGGPPFRTDDPETPGSGNWEINFGWIGDRNLQEGEYELPNIDMNYGWGNRIQLKYELPLAMHEMRDGKGSLAAGLGDSLLGVKWRFFEYVRDAAGKKARNEDASDPDFSVSTYPQLSLNNPTSSVRRGIVDPGPQFLLPVEANASFGPVRVDGEVGYWFTNRHVPQSWIRGLIAGHEFGAGTEVYAEIYDEQDANRVDGEPKQREATLGLGGRRGLNHTNSILLLLMAGRSFQRVAVANSQPSWIAYAGVQVLLGSHEKAALPKIAGAAGNLSP